MSQWYIYIVRCCDGSLYTGITIDVARRFAEHCGKGKAGAKYLKSRRPLKLVFQAKIGNQALAMKVERKVKKLPKDKKEKLINGDINIKALIKQFT
jgi:putative endonuclease